jgi:uncharacterized membrane protein YGL010W
VKPHLWLIEFIGLIGRRPALLDALIAVLALVLGIDVNTALLTVYDAL